MPEILLSSQAAKFIKQADSVLARRLLEKLELLQTDPLPREAKRIVGREGLLRVRVGDYRILYTVKKESNAILVDRIDKRSHVYD